MVFLRIFLTSFGYSVFDLLASVIRGCVNLRVCTVGVSTVTIVICRIVNDQVKLSNKHLHFFECLLNQEQFHDYSKLC